MAQLYPGCALFTYPARKVNIVYSGSRKGEGCVNNGSGLAAQCGWLFFAVSRPLVPRTINLPNLTAGVIPVHGCACCSAMLQSDSPSPVYSEPPCCGSGNTVAGMDNQS